MTRLSDIACRALLALLLVCATTAMFSGSRGVGAFSPQLCKPWPVGGRPAQAAAWGYDCLRMYTTFPNLNAIDVNNTGNPGYDWYVIGNGWINVPNSGACATWSSASPIPSSQFASSGGNLIFNGATAAGGGTAMQTAVANASPAGYVGNAVGSGADGFFVDFNFAFALLRPAGVSFSNWPSGWSMPIEFLNNQISPTDYFAELDAFEDLANTTGASSPIMSVNEWNCSGYHESTNGFNSVSLSGITTTNLNDYQMLQVPMSKNGGTGLIQRYLNGVHQSALDLTYAMGSAPGNGISRTNGLTEIDTEHFVFMMSTGYGPTNPWPLTVGSFALWTPTP